MEGVVTGIVIESRSVEEWDGKVSRWQLRAAQCQTPDHLRGGWVLPLASSRSQVSVEGWNNADMAVLSALIPLVSAVMTFSPF